MKKHFRFDSGRLSLSYAATIWDREREPVERWIAPADLARWCVEAGVLDDPPTFNVASLDQAKILREAVYRLVQAVRRGAKPRSDDVRTVNEWARRDPMTPVLGNDGRSISRHIRNPLEATLSTVARDVIDLVSGTALERVRQCEGPACSMLFLDTSRPGMRRWCSMERCGNKAKKEVYLRKTRPKERRPTEFRPNGKN